jgi:hypothetical protein
MNYNAAFLVMDDIKGMPSILRQIGIRNLTRGAN